MKEMLTKKELAKEFGMCERTVQSKIGKIEELQIIRYSPYSVLRSGKTLMCNVVAFFDFLIFESALTDENLKKHAPKFNYEEAKKQLGFRRNNG